MQLRVDPHGTIHGLYTERIDLSALGHILIAPASHVEPDARGRWHADLAPVDGPSLGPFERRSEALAAEVQWLEAHWLACPQGPCLASMASDVQLPG
jgi:hypothetical protein